MAEQSCYILLEWRKTFLFSSPQHFVIIAGYTRNMGLSSSLCFVSFRWHSNLPDLLLSKHLCYTVILLIASHFTMKRLIISYFLNVPRLFLYRLKILTETWFLGSLENFVWNCEKPVNWEEKAHILGYLYMSHQRNKMIFSRGFRSCLVQNWIYYHQRVLHDGVSEVLFMPPKQFVMQWFILHRFKNVINWTKIFQASIQH